jgi:F0F1-type ATP synthase assembly protein I
MKIKLFSLATFFALLLIVVPLAFAQTNLRAGKNDATLRADEVIGSDYFSAGDTVTLAGTVDGDAYLAGGNVDVTGTVNGDVLAAGGNVNISGKVNGNVRVAGGNLNISGTVGKNLTTAGGTIIVTDQAKINGSGVIVGGNVSLLAPITKGLTIGGGQVNIANQVGGDINAGVGKLTLSPLAKVNGNLIYWSEDVADISSQASVSGQITQNIPPKNSHQDKETGQKSSAGGAIVFKIFSFITALVMGLLLLWLVPSFVERTTLTIYKSPLLSFGIGFLAVALTPFIVLLLLITLVGIPFIFVWLFVLVFSLWMAKVFISVAVGLWIVRVFRQKTSIYLAFSSGLVIYYLLSMIPVIGWIVGFISGMIGLGALMITKRNYYQDLRQKKII